MAENIVQVTDETFEAEVLKAEGPVLVDFWAPWCGPCRMVGPIVEELATEFAGRVKVAHVDVDQAREHATKFGVMSVPTVLYMKNGAVTDSQIGLSSREKMVEKINNML